jgi:hypothetical protein
MYIDVIGGGEKLIKERAQDHDKLRPARSAETIAAG